MAARKIHMPPMVTAFNIVSTVEKLFLREREESSRERSTYCIVFVTLFLLALGQCQQNWHPQ
jgi:hypothetical protein